MSETEKRFAALVSNKCFYLIAAMALMGLNTGVMYLSDTKDPNLRDSPGFGWLEDLRPMELYLQHRPQETLSRDRIETFKRILKRRTKGLPLDALIPIVKDENEFRANLILYANDEKGNGANIFLDYGDSWRALIPYDVLSLKNNQESILDNPSWNFLTSDVSASVVARKEGEVNGKVVEIFTSITISNAPNVDQLSINVGVYDQNHVALDAYAYMPHLEGSGFAEFINKYRPLVAEEFIEKYSSP